MSTSVIASASRQRALALLLVAGALLITGSALWGRAQEDSATRRATRGLEQNGIQGRTKPSKEMDLAFPLLGQVSEVLVKEGNRVEAGQVLIKQDVAADEARLRGLEAKADVVVLVKLAEAQRDLAKVELEVALLGGPAVPPLEVRRAELEVEVGETRIAEQERQGRIDAFAAEEQRILIDYKQIKSPDTGFVQSVDATVGEVFGPQTPALRVVKIDPLHVEVLIADASVVRRLKVGDSVQVRYEDETEWREAKVIVIKPVGDPTGAGKSPFVAELANPEGRPAGLPVRVRLPS